MQKKLTPRTIDSLPPATGKRYEVRDILLPGLLLRVSQSGSKVWYLTTRVQGRLRRIKIGTYPILTLADAREKARENLRDIQLGRFEQPEPPKDPTLGEIIPQFIDLYAKPRNRHWRGSQSLLKKFASLDARPITEIRRSDIVRILDELVASGTPCRANRALAAIKKLFAWCVDRGTIDINPLTALKPPTKEVARDRVLTSDEVANCWRAAEAEAFPFGPFLKILILTGQRRGEVAGMRWSELDLQKGIWTLPAKRAKNATQHAVPLAPVAVELLEGLPRFSKSDIVFTTNGRTPISGFGRLKMRLDQGMGITPWRIHDLRRTMATNMAEAGVQPHVIEAVLNHKSGIVSGVAAVYNRHAYLDEKRTALEGWADTLCKVGNAKVHDGKRSRTMAIAGSSGTQDRTGELRL